MRRSASPAMSTYSFVIPTYKRPDVLEQCLQHIAELSYDLQRVDVFVIDNGESEHCQAVGDRFQDRLQLTYEVNPENLGPGGSLNKGLGMATGDRIIVINDDAMVPKSFLSRCDEVFEEDSNIGCVGFRAIEDDYVSEGDEIGTILSSGRVVGNFDRMTGQPVDVDHVYGFCYAISRDALNAAGPFDPTLLAKIYASGNRIETDHCLEIRRQGFRVLYDGQTGIRHLAKPRLDIEERSLKWRLNDVRNTLYMFLKHFGPFGNRAVAIKYAAFHDLGVLSMLKSPSQSNIRYFAMGMRARLSAIGHWVIYLTNRRNKPFTQETSH